MKRKAWGKADGESFHSLAHHSMDVAAVFARMMQLPIIRNRMEMAAVSILASNKPLGSALLLASRKRPPSATLFVLAPSI